MGSWKGTIHAKLRNNSNARRWQTYYWLNSWIRTLSRKKRISYICGGVTFFKPSRYFYFLSHNCHASIIILYSFHFKTLVLYFVMYTNLKKLIGIKNNWLICLHRNILLFLSLFYNFSFLNAKSINKYFPIKKIVDTIQTRNPFPVISPFRLPFWLLLFQLQWSSPW
jgi:hypothetical protein